ncbi:Integral membrane protein 2B [Heterocephalus glaber]|uniref:Integral membrane protein 2 n=1 Tax=Heterocephalus glaber TaxID=10181 RepID=G5BJX8_HETGA|nr:Integral membrane protein 2B [Heterocephalus glaber]
MVKVTFFWALAQKEAKKDEPKSGEEALIIPLDSVTMDCKDPDDVPSAVAPAARYKTIEENIKIFKEDEVEFISVPVPEFADSDSANIVHDFNKKLTANLDLNLNKCYMIPLNTSTVRPPRNLLELLINIKAETYLPQSYLIHEHMVITDRIENIDHLGFFIYRLCHDKETYKLQCRETIKGIQKHEASNCVTIRHFENKFAMETLICP